MRSELVIGKVLRPRGLKGEIKVEIYASDPHWLASFKGQVRVGGVPYDVIKFIHEGMGGFITLKGVENVDEAEKLRGKDILISRVDLPPVKNGEYYIVDILGMDVRVAGETIGKICDVAQYGSADVYTVRTADGTISFPALKQLIKRVDIDGGVMELDDIVFDRVKVFNP